MQKNIKDISIFLNVRVASTRCRNKMLRAFSDSTLIDICLEKLHELTGFDIYYGAHEKELLDKAKSYDFLKVIKRTYESAISPNDGKKIFEILNYIGTKWVLWINPCAPFLEMKTVMSAIEKFLRIENNSLTSAKKVYGWFYDNSGEPLTNKENRIATQESDYLLEVAHAFHIYERKYMLETGKPWINRKGEPYLYVIPNEESYDIDTESEFIAIESLFRHANRREGAEFII
ncbi:hypothetical protein C4565_05310 [Candidatus Parcubacteria bacterium]|nr:MAG: hypothetical protein C4565_05310 [Candidatus Parcubacteria bacterium]